MLFQKKQNPYQANQQAGTTNKRNTLIGLSIVTVLLLIITAFLSTSNKQLSQQELASIYYKFENSQFSLSIPKNFAATTNLAGKITFQPRAKESKNNPKDLEDFPATGQLTVTKYIKSFVLNEPVEERIEKLNFYDLDGNEIVGLKLEEKQINNDKAVIIQSDKAMQIFLIKPNYVWKLEFQDSSTEDIQDSKLVSLSEQITASLEEK